MASWFGTSQMSLRQNKRGANLDPEVGECTTICTMHICTSVGQDGVATCAIIEYHSATGVPRKEERSPMHLLPTVTTSYLFRFRKSYLSFVVCQNCILENLSAYGHCLATSSTQLSHLALTFKRPVGVGGIVCQNHRQQLIANMRDV